MSTATGRLTFGFAATRIGAQAHHLARLARRGLIPYTTTGRFRVVSLEDLPAIRAVCVAHGYIPATPATGAAESIARESAVAPV